jgi:hypothetical protein
LGGPADPLEVVAGSFAAVGPVISGGGPDGMVEVGVTTQITGGGFGLVLEPAGTACAVVPIPEPSDVSETGTGGVATTTTT